MRTEEQWREHALASGVRTIEGRLGVKVEGVGTWCAVYLREHPSRECERWMAVAETNTYGPTLSHSVYGFGATVERALMHARRRLANIQREENERGHMTITYAVVEGSS